jgi:polyhydroxyalkanoate synthesis repressor PhaR
MSEQRLIRKYVNRRLYDTAQSRYVNLDDLRELIVKGTELKIVEQATGTDITTPVMLQIIAEGERSGTPLLSPEFLAGMIRLGARERDPDLAARINGALTGALINPARSTAVSSGPAPATNAG